jgi:mannobiose 2-epimerase
MSASADKGIPDLRDHVLTHVLPFWERHSIDRDHGGFITHLARDGTITDSSAKFLVMQTRMIYSFACGFDLGGPADWLKLAGQGVDFLLRHFRDPVHDGWYWSTFRDGRARQVAKRTYGHAFCVLALAEYARVSGERRALAAAVHTWSLISSFLWDAENEGAIEACDRAWRGTDNSHRMGTHLHVLEALLALSTATSDDRFLPPIRSICDLLVTRMVEAHHQCGLEYFSPDWQHDAIRSRNLADYGHNLEAAWLLLRVHQQEDVPAYRDTARQFLDYCLRFGLDRVHGGVFSHGPVGQTASAREKIWWVQCEAMAAFLLGHLVFSDPEYWHAFQQVASFCMTHLHDPEHGEWFSSTEEHGAPGRTDKGSGWKAAYHVTQACCYAQQYLSEIRPPA